MNDDIIILDDFLPAYIQDKLEDLCCDIPWYLMENSTFSKNCSLGEKIEKKGDYVDSEQFSHVFWSTNTREPITNSPIINYDNYINFSHYFSLPLQISSIKNGFTFNLKDNLYRGKLNLTHSQSSPTPLIKPPHIDIKEDIDYLRNNAWAIIYYVNDSDGDTIVYNETEELLDLTQYTIREKISPKKGRIVFLKGHLFHSASVPSSKYSKRIVINYNLVF